MQACPPEKRNHINIPRIAVRRGKNRTMEDEFMKQKLAASRSRKAKIKGRGIQIDFVMKK